VCDHTPDRPPIKIELRTGDQPMTIETVNGAVGIRPGSIQDPDAVIPGPPPLVFSVLAGKLDLAQVRAARLHCKGIRRSCAEYSRWLSGTKDRQTTRNS
jgi:hypothetical protein